MQSICVSYSHPATDLVEDVKRMVLDYISVPSDLQALCLVSRSWDHVATTSLYKNVVLDIRLQDSQLLRFEQCLQLGASRNLRHTQSLHLCDFASIFGLVAYSDKESNKEADRHEAILRVLQLFPENRLSTFRYVCDVPFSAACIRHLNLHQSAIRNVHITQCDPLELLAHPRRSITAAFDDKIARTAGFVDFAIDLPPLDFLSLQFWGGWGNSEALYWAGLTNPLAGQIIVARAITIYGCMPTGFTSNVPQIFDWSIVTSLSLVEGNLWLLLDDLAPLLELSNLVHFQCCTLDVIQPEQSRTLQGLFARNQNLEHVQLGMTGLAQLPMRAIEHFAHKRSATDTESLLWPIRDGLRSLALYDAFYAAKSTENFTIGAALDLICHNFPRLRELGIAAPPEAHDGGNAGIVSVDSLIRSLKPLSYLNELRMLHLYEVSWSRLNDLGRLQPKQRPALDIEHFATALFRWAHTHCPQLEVLAWGLHAKGFDVSKINSWESGRDENEPFPQLFFMKKQETVQDHGERILATPTTRGRIRDRLPELLLPTFDPGFSEMDRLAI